MTALTYEKVKTVQASLTTGDHGKKFTIKFDVKGKARLTVKDGAGNVLLTKEYTSSTVTTKTEEVILQGASIAATLELAAIDTTAPAENTVFEVSYSQSESVFGVVQMLPQTYEIPINLVRLSYTGTGATFYVSTNDPLKWQKVEPNKETILNDPGTTITVKAMLKIEPATVVYDYTLDLNPYHDMSFTGKFLEPEIGLVYFGGRWYEPGIGRWFDG